MTRILTIIALLFATPVLAYPECEVPEVSKPRECKNCLKPQIICNDTRENCTKRRAEIAARLKKADDELAVSLGYKEAKEMYRARNICRRIRDNFNCSKLWRELKCLNFREQQQKKSGFEDLEDRVDELEAEVEQLRNR